ncbi:hypothetical protein NEF87_001283 [Candidatus Lokiarchaeum ossiferum]|uniref:Methyl-accepting chemotaxis protein n=1 Tax=Candidatus Lokiarchaeum ossiferum TaxID=2951803 RepID=A0ABY6HNA3_9ARCH|nr:hypothetical protein NEF87_001283 [Candidatus Lokiarchaeum sp. B-35]
MKIRVKMLLLLICSILITSFTGTMIGQKYSRNYIQQSFRTDISKNLHYYASGIQNEIQRAYYESLALADDPSGVAWFEGTLGENDTNLVKNLYIEKMKLLLENNLTAFAASKETNEFWIGENLIQTLSENTPDDSWFYDSLTSGIKASTNVDSNDQLQTTSLWINVLMGDENDPIGVAGIGIELTDLVKSFVASNPSENSILMLIDSRDVIQVSSNNISGIERSEYFKNKDIVSSDVAGFEDQLEYIEDGKHYIVVEEVLAPTDLKVILLVPEEDFVPSLISLSAPALIAATILSVIVLVSAVILIRQFMQSLEHVEKSVHAYSKGDLHKIEELSENNDETTEIVRNFKKIINNVSSQTEINKLIFDSTVTPLCFIDPENKIKEVGNSLLELTGMKRDDIEGKNIKILFEDLKEYELSHEKYLKQGYIKNFNFSLKNVLGKKIVATLNVIKMHDKNNKFIGELITFIDVSDFRELVKEVRFTADEVKTMAKQVSESSNQINFSVQDVSNGTQEMAKGAQDQNKSAIEIVEAVSRVKQVSENIVKKTETIAHNSKNGGNLAQTGKHLIDDLLSRMDEMSNGATQVSAVMSSLDTKSKEINKIVDVIAGIATETNLLALNAAIEAARAGDAGKGFAVVAEQVRKLAEDSKQAADQINDLISEIKNEVSVAVKETTSTESAINNGKVALDETALQLENLFEIIQKTDFGIGEVIKNIEEQDSDIVQIVQEIEQINGIIEQSSGTAQELSSSIEEMAATLEELSTVADELNTGSSRLYNEIQNF